MRNLQQRFIQKPESVKPAELKTSKTRMTTGVSPPSIHLEFPHLTGEEITDIKTA